MANDRYKPPVSECLEVIVYHDHGYYHGMIIAIDSVDFLIQFWFSPDRARSGYFNRTTRLLEGLQMKFAYV